MVNKIGTNIHPNDTLIWKIIFIEDKLKNTRIPIDKEKLIYTNNSDQKYSCVSNVINTSLSNTTNTKLVRI